MARSKDAADYVGALFGCPVSDGELYSGDIDYLYAMRWHDCEKNCPGVNNCGLRGYAPRVYEEELCGRRVFVVRATRCGMCQTFVEQKRLGELIKASRIPAELAPCRLENYRPLNKSTEDAKKAAVFCAETGRGLLLAGPPGVGKTHLAAAIVNHVISCGRSAIFTPVVNLLGELKDAIMFSRVATITEALREADCLVLDDLGIQKDSAWVGEKLYELINDRYNSKKQIIITTNARSMEDLKSMIGPFGPQIESRLSKMAIWQAIEAPDFRKRKKAAA